MKLSVSSASTGIPPEEGRDLPCFHTRHVMVRLFRPSKPAFSVLPALSLHLFRSCLLPGVCLFSGVPLTYKPCPCWPQAVSFCWDSLRNSHWLPQELLSTHHAVGLSIVRSPFVICMFCTGSLSLILPSVSRLSFANSQSVRSTCPWPHRLSYPDPTRGKSEGFRHYIKQNSKQRG